MNFLVSFLIVWTQGSAFVLALLDRDSDTK